MIIVWSAGMGIEDGKIFVSTGLKFMGWSTDGKKTDDEWVNMGKNLCA